MDNKSKIFFAVFFTLIVGSVFATYYRYVMVRDYIIEAEAPCDPYSESCFVYVCDSEAGEECTGDPEEDTSYYKVIHRNAKNIPLCDPNDEDCEALVCPVGEADCEISLCDPEVEEDIECSDPVAYTEEHPIEEETLDEEGEESDVDAETETEGESNIPEEGLSVEESAISTDTVEEVVE